MSRSGSARIAELDIEVHEDEFGYWRKFDKESSGAANSRARRAGQKNIFGSQSTSPARR